ncbi:MAG: SIS domain-containing protein [Candidatus Limnocylindrales bacterium]
MTTRSELGEGPAIVERLLDEAAASITSVATEMTRRKVELVVIAARGTSDHAALYAQYILGSRNGLPVALAAPSLTSLYGTAPKLRNAAVIGISQSGRSPDVVAVLADARRQGALTVAITNDPSSELAESADVVVDLCAGSEDGVAATKTYLAEIAVIAMLSGALSADRASHAELRALPTALRDALAVEDRVVRLADAWSSEDRSIVLARGFQYATAREWALKLKELALMVAEPYSGADFEHGPIALIEAGYPVLAVVSSGAALRGMVDLLRRLRAIGARLIVLSDDDDVLHLGDGIRLPVGVPEWLAPLVAIVPAQLFAYHLAVARGLDPETPRNLRKITLTT